MIFIYVQTLIMLMIYHNKWLYGRDLKFKLLRGPNEDL